jgi:multimeric flavodoxin WrbA
MKVLSIIGSPRKNGNTSIMSDMLFERLNQKNFDLEKVFLTDLEVNPCTDCRACKKGELVCTVNDDMPDLYQKIEQSEVFVIGTPIYWYGPTAQMKAMLDRFRPYFYNGKLKGKKLALLLPAGSGHGDCELTISMLKRMSEALEIKYLGAVTAEAYDEGDVLKNDSVSQAINELSKAIKVIF